MLPAPRGDHRPASLRASPGDRDRRTGGLRSPEGFYNPVRRHSRLDNRSPIAHEENLTTRTTQIEASA